MKNSVHPKFLLVVALLIGGAGLIGFMLAASELSEAVRVGAAIGAFVVLAGCGHAAVVRALAPVQALHAWIESLSAGIPRQAPDIPPGSCCGKLAAGLQDLVEANRRHTDWLMSILNAIPASISVTDMDMRWMLCNTAALKSMDKTSMDTVLGRHCSEKRGNLCNTERCGITMLGRGIKDVVIQLPSGHTMKVQLEYLHDQSGKRIGHLEFSSDITQLKQRERDAVILARSGRIATADELTDVVERLNVATSTLREQVSTTQTRINEVSGRMNETATAMEEMYATVQNVASNADSAAEATSSVVEQAQEGATLMGRTVGDMNRVQEQSLLIKTEMERLAEQANTIGNVLTLISDIADQTNLLALNAAIEAARAGEAGRGFAVVADEVRKLAEKTMNATKEVETAIAAIQTSADNSLTTVNNAVQAIDGVVALAGETDTVLTRITELSENAGPAVTAIATAAGQQNQTTEAVNRSIAEVNHLAGDAVTDMSRAMEEVNGIADCSQGIRKILEDIRAKVREEEKAEADALPTDS